AGQLLGRAAGGANRSNLEVAADLFLIRDQPAVGGPIRMRAGVLVAEIVFGEQPSVRSVGVHNIQFRRAVAGVANVDNATTIGARRGTRILGTTDRGEPARRIVPWQADGVDVRPVLSRTRVENRRTIRREIRRDVLG